MFQLIYYYVTFLKSGKEMKTTVIRILSNCNDDLEALMRRDPDAERCDKPTYLSRLVWEAIAAREIKKEEERK